MQVHSYTYPTLLYYACNTVYVTGTSLKQLPTVILDNSMSNFSHFGHHFFLVCSINSQIVTENLRHLRLNSIST